MAVTIQSDMYSGLDEGSSTLLIAVITVSHPRTMLKLSGIAISQSAPAMVHIE
jgi:hypothetical protein